MKKNTTQPKSHHYSKQTKELASIEGHATSRLLWHKILAVATPEVREMLFAHLHLENAVRRILPEEYAILDACQMDHFQLLDRIHKAEALLTGMTPEVHEEVFVAPMIAKSANKAGVSWENFPALVNEES